MSKLREDLLFTLTGDSYGERLYVDNTAQTIVDDLIPVIKALMLEMIDSVTEVEDIPNQHVPAEYIPDANLLREKVNAL